MKNVTLRQLRALASVAQHGNFARAAIDLNLTPPAVSMQIKELEHEVGLPLFDREARHVSLTLTGEYLLAYARRMLAELKNAQDMVARLQRLAAVGARHRGDRRWRQRGRRRRIAAQQRGQAEHHQADQQ